jgi:hypothetical protein
MCTISATFSLPLGPTISAISSWSCTFCAPNFLPHLWNDHRPYRSRKDPLPCSFNCREYSNYHCHSFQLFSFFLSLTYLNQGLGLNWIINLRERICSHIDSSSATTTELLIHHGPIIYAREKFFMVTNILSFYLIKYIYIS